MSLLRKIAELRIFFSLIFLIKIITDEEIKFILLGKIRNLTVNSFRGSFFAESKKKVLFFSFNQNSFAFLCIYKAKLKSKRSSPQKIYSQNNLTNRLLLYFPPFQVGKLRKGQNSQKERS